MARILVYALGGGLGHVQRSLALARAAARRDHQTTVLTNSASVGKIRPHWEQAELDEKHIRIDVLTGAPTSILLQAKDRVEAAAHDLLLVDTLPRGIGGELDEVLARRRTPAVFVHRDLKPSYAARPAVRAAARGYDLVLSPGERGPLADELGALETKPWLLLNADELEARSAARRALGVPNEEHRPVVVVCASTDPAEHRGLAALTLRWQHELESKALVVPSAISERWPLLRWHLGIDLLIGAGGYNTVYEARATKTPLRALARNRTYDRQSHRLREAEQLGAHLPVAPRETGVVWYQNGTEAALDAMHNLL